MSQVSGVLRAGPAHREVLEVCTFAGEGAPAGEAHPGGAYHTPPWSDLGTQQADYKLLKASPQWLK